MSREFNPQPPVAEPFVDAYDNGPQPSAVQPVAEPFTQSYDPYDEFQDEWLTAPVRHAGSSPELVAASPADYYSSGEWPTLEDLVTAKRSA